MSDDELPVALRAENIEWLWEHLDADERLEFRQGLRSPLHDLVDSFTGGAEEMENAPAAVLADLLRYLDSWIVSSRLSHAEDWKRRMKLTARAADEATEADVRTVADIRALIA